MGQVVFAVARFIYLSAIMPQHLDVLKQMIDRMIDVFFFADLPPVVEAVLGTAVEDTRQRVHGPGI